MALPADKYTPLLQYKILQCISLKVFDIKNMRLPLENRTVRIL